MNVTHPDPKIEFAKRVLYYLGSIVVFGSLAILALVTAALLISWPLVLMVVVEYEHILTFEFLYWVAWLGFLGVIVKAGMDTLEAHEND